MVCELSCFFFFFNDTATTEIYTLSLHDALPICGRGGHARLRPHTEGPRAGHPAREGQLQHLHQPGPHRPGWCRCRSEEHTSELQSRQYLVCRLLLEKKKKETSSLYFFLKSPVHI